MQTTISATAIELTRIRHPVVRHLAWMCQAPQLLDSSLVLDPFEHLPPDIRDVLVQWDACPERGPGLLGAIPNPRLGLYFESLYECLMTKLLG